MFFVLLVSILFLTTPSLAYMVISGTSDVAFASVYSEKTHLKKLMIMVNIILMNKSQTVY